MKNISAGMVWAVLAITYGITLAATDGNRTSETRTPDVTSAYLTRVGIGAAIVIALFVFGGTLGD